MLALFCLRLALGLMACLLIVPARLTHPRYYRTHCLITLGLTLVALCLLPPKLGELRVALAAATLLSLVGSVVWRMEGAPGGQTLTVLTASALVVSLVTWEQAGTGTKASAIPGALVGDLASAALLGAALSAMLMGHSYLIAPGMSLSPLMRLIGALAMALAVRALVDGYALWWWFAEHSLRAAGNEALLGLAMRWLAGFILPLGATWMAWQAARTSTQSATGILYVVVIFCFLGELTALLLREPAGLAL